MQGMLWMLLCLPCPAQSPYLVVLGTAQDAGVPQLACPDETCRLAREDPLRVEDGQVLGHQRLPTSLLLVDPQQDRRFLFEASPALPRQIELARELGHWTPAEPEPGASRPPLVDGIFITHAHMGHYAGLLQLGREAYGSAPVPLHGSERLLGFLQSQGPWSLLFEGEHLSPAPFTSNESFVLTDQVRIEAWPVPHRDEFSDTHAFVIQGPRRKVLFLPDIDKWERWDEWESGARRLEDVLAQVDLALLDATFYADGEIPGRAMADIPHPFVAETLARLAPLPRESREKVRFLHLNHTNPLCLGSGEAWERVQAAGCQVLREGMILEL